MQPAERRKLRSEPVSSPLGPAMFGGILAPVVIVLGRDAPVDAGALADAIVARFSALVPAGIVPFTGAPAAGAASPHAQGIPFDDFALNPDLNVERPRGIIETSTLAHEKRLTAQMAREGVPVDPPNAEAFLAWANTHPRSRAALDNHRRAYVRLLYYYGLPVPPIMQRRWDDKRAVSVAKRAGLRKERERHFKSGLWDIVKLLEGEPFAEAWRNAAFHHAVALACVTGPRSSEPRDLLLQNVHPERRLITDWWQEKKDTFRTVSVPEEWLFRGPGPTVAHYLAHVRPKFNPVIGDEHYFVNTEGVGFSSAATWSNNFIGAGIRRVLGYSIGPHSFRRFCATMKTVFGYSLTEVADFLDDTEDVVRASYIDRTFVRLVGIRHKEPGDEQPMPPLWKLPAVLDLEVPDDF